MGCNLRENDRNRGSGSNSGDGNGDDSSNHNEEVNNNYENPFNSSNLPEGAVVAAYAPSFTTNPHQEFYDSNNEGESLSHDFATEEAQKPVGELEPNINWSNVKENLLTGVDVINKTAGFISYAAFAVGLPQVGIIAAAVTLTTDAILSSQGKKGMLEISINGFIDFAAKKAGPIGQAVAEVSKTVNSQLLDGK